MGFWLKCPGCQARNPLSLQVCPHCGRSLDNLSPQQRVYVIGPPEAPAPEPSSGPPPSSEVEEPEEPAGESSPPAAAAQGATKPKRSRKKKE